MQTSDLNHGYDDGDFTVVVNVSKIIVKCQPWPFAAADGCYWPGAPGPGRGNSRGHSTGPHCTGTSGTGGQTQAWYMCLQWKYSPHVLYCCMVNSHSSDRGCSAPSAPGSSPSLSPAPSAAAPRWLAAQQCVCADGSYPADSLCTPTAGCLDYAEPDKKMKKRRSLHGVKTVKTTQGCSYRGNWICRAGQGYQWWNKYSNHLLK